jgi:hypothetical protein
MSMLHGTFRRTFKAADQSDALPRYHYATLLRVWKQRPDSNWDLRSRCLLLVDPACPLVSLQLGARI